MNKLVKIKNNNDYKKKIVNNKVVMFKASRLINAIKKEKGTSNVMKHWAMGQIYKGLGWLRK